MHPIDFAAMRLLTFSAFLIGVGLWNACAMGGDVAMVRDGTRVELRSPAFVFTLDVSDGLRGVAWENRLAGKSLDLGGGA